MNHFHFKGDTNAANNLMSEFSNFCANSNGLLKEFWKTAVNKCQCEPEMEEDEEDEQWEQQDDADIAL